MLVILNKPKIIYAKTKKNDLPDEAYDLLFSSLSCAVLFVFLCLVLVTEIRLRPIREPVVDLQEILRAALTPMPSVRYGSLNTLYYTYPPRKNNYIDNDIIQFRQISFAQVKYDSTVRSI
jgi:hypothetical protein